MTRAELSALTVLVAILTLDTAYAAQLLWQSWVASLVVSLTSSGVGALVVVTSKIQGYALVEADEQELAEPCPQPKEAGLYD